jgi:hypothetical protein
MIKVLTPYMAPELWDVGVERSGQVFLQVQICLGNSVGTLERIGFCRDSYSPLT